MRSKITPRLLQKYVDGKCTDTELVMLNEWYQSFDAETDPLDVLNDVEQEALKMLMLNRFKASVNRQALTVVHRAQTKSIHKIKVILAGAAAMLLLFSGIYFFKKAGILQGSPQAVATNNLILNNQTNSIYKQVLADGSVVWLNPNSKLEFPQHFTGQFREVKMTGEAFFEVTKDHSHPFIIYSGGVVTRVWGTSFRIKAYSNVPTEVSVVTGKVSVKLPDAHGEGVMLYPTQKVVYHKTNHKLVCAKESNNTSMRIWQKASVNFDNVPLDVVLSKLETQFGIRIYTNDKELGQYLLNADFTDQNLPSILEMIESSMNVSYTVSDTEIELSRKNLTN